MPLTTARLVRTARLLSLPAGTAALAAEGAVRRLAGQDRERVAQDLRERNAARTRAVLGGLKGGALKAGQLLSTVEALFPQDPESTWRETLAGLQDGNAPLPFADVEPVLRGRARARLARAAARASSRSPPPRRPSVRCTAPATPRAARWR